MMDVSTQKETLISPSIQVWRVLNNQFKKKLLYISNYMWKGGHIHIRDI